jgi:hypothetical protein
VNDLGSPEGRPIGHRTKTGPEPSEVLGERSWSHRGGSTLGGGDVFGRPMDPRPTATVCHELRPLMVEPVDLVIDARAFGIPLAEASRVDRSDAEHALLPAGIFSSTVQLGARGDVVFRVMLGVPASPDP